MRPGVQVLLPRLGGEEHKNVAWAPAAPCLLDLLRAVGGSPRLRCAKPVLLLCLAGAAILQLFDVQPLREQIIASIAAGPGVEELERDQVARLVTRARLIEVVPSFQCSSDKDGMSSG